jgi:hypothetical protein
MTQYHGDDTVEPGTYLNLRRLRVETLEEKGRLPGDGAAVWRRVPETMLLVAAPFVGLLYVVFLPLIGFLMLGKVVAEWAAAQAADALGATVRVLRPAWQPAVAFLGRGRRTPEGEDAREERPDPWAETARAAAAEDVAGDTTADAAAEEGKR